MHSIRWVWGYMRNYQVKYVSVHKGKRTKLVNLKKKTNFY